MLVKLGVVASLASILARSSSFRRLFFAEQRRPAQTLALLAFFLVPLTLGVWIRIAVPNFLAADISFEAIVLLGLFVGPGWAMLGGVVLSLPAEIIANFWLCRSMLSSDYSPACWVALSNGRKSGPSRPSSTSASIAG